MDIGPSNEFLLGEGRKGAKHLSLYAFVPVLEWRKGKGLAYDRGAIAGTGKNPSRIRP